MERVGVRLWVPGDVGRSPTFLFDPDRAPPPAGKRAPGAPQYRVAFPSFTT